jgi:REP element-mobilizing transposase RayT
MKYNPDYQHRHSIRLNGFDYAENEAYFVTICIWQRIIRLGEIVGGKMIPNQFGEALRQVWNDLPNHTDSVIIDESIVMPYHFHGIIMISNPPESVQQSKNRLPEIVRQLKTFSARRINSIKNVRGVPVWQRNYYERIIRNQKELEAVRKYIVDNPLNWEKDKYEIQ